MREKLNNNPMAQLGVIGVLILAAAFFLLSGMGGGGSSTATPAAAPTTTTTPTATLPGAAPATTDPAVASLPGSTPTTTATPTVSTPIPAPPLPPPVKSAYDSGRTVVLFVHGAGIDDRLVTTTVRTLSSLGAAVFTVPVKQVARYGAITLGVNLERVPALVVVRPRGLSGGTPQASVSYGFQSPQAIRQAVRDASYNGPGSTYQPN